MSNKIKLFGTIVSDYKVIEHHTLTITIAVEDEPLESGHPMDSYFKLVLKGSNYDAIVRAGKMGQMISLKGTISQMSVPTPAGQKVEQVIVVEEFLLLNPVEPKGETAEMRLIRLACGDDHEQDAAGDIWDSMDKESQKEFIDDLTDESRKAFVQFLSKTDRCKPSMALQIHENAMLQCLDVMLVDTNEVIDSSLVASFTFNQIAGYEMAMAYAELFCAVCPVPTLDKAADLEAILKETEKITTV